jgi:hypothetical protein
VAHAHAMANNQWIQEIRGGLCVQAIAEYPTLEQTGSEAVELQNGMLHQGSKSAKSAYLMLRQGSITTRRPRANLENLGPATSQVIPLAGLQVTAAMASTTSWRHTYSLCVIKSRNHATICPSFAPSHSRYGRWSWWQSAANTIPKPARSHCRIGWGELEAIGMDQKEKVSTLCWSWWLGRFGNSVTLEFSEERKFQWAC